MRFENQLFQYFYDAYTMFSPQEYFFLFAILYMSTKARADNTLLPFKNFNPKHALIAFGGTVFGPALWATLTIIFFTIIGLLGGDGPSF